MNSHRKNIMLGTAGHVDHGKTALVKTLTGCDTDTLAEEKERGLTIDLGFAPCRLAGNRVVGIVDVPGHVDFIRNMVAGAHGIDVVMLVIAADDGIMPQTREHLNILALMGLRRGLVALTKIDLVEPSRRKEVVEHLKRLLAGTFLESAPICPLSNVTGEGFEQFFEALHRVVDACEERPSGGLFRVWVEDVFTIRGSGTIVTGIPSSGTVRVGNQLQLAPGTLSGHVRRMQVYGEESAEARAGECVAMNLPELEHLAVRRGQVLCEADASTSVTMAEADLQVLPSVKSRIEDYLEVHLHVGTASGLARVAMLENDEMIAGQKQMVQLRLAEPLALAPGDRFVVRASVADGSGGGLTTIGGGRILGIGDARLRRKKPWTLAMLAARGEALGHAEKWCELMLQEKGAPLGGDELRRKCLMRPDEFATLAGKLEAAGAFMRSRTGAWIHRHVLQQAASRVLQAVQSFHTKNPQRAGLGREELFAAAGGDPVLAEEASELLLRTGQIQSNGTVLAQAGWAPKVGDRDQELCERIAEALRKGRWAPPSTAEIAASLGELPPKTERLVRLLLERGVVVRLDERVLMHREAVAAAQDVALKLFSTAPSFSTMQFRDALGVSRKYAVPLLDHLDRMRFTVRSGHDRMPGVEAKKRLSSFAACQ